MPVYYSNGINQVSGNPSESWFTIETVPPALTFIMQVNITTSADGVTEADKTQSVYDRCVNVADNYSGITPAEPTPVDIPAGWTPS